MESTTTYISYAITEIFCIFFSVGIIKANKNVGTDLQMRQKCADLMPQISVCTGYAVCKSGAITATQLIAQADEQLYIQKEIYHGRRKPDAETASE